MKKQYKMIRAWSVVRKRPLEVIASTNPTTVPIGETPMAQLIKH